MSKKQPSNSNSSLRGRDAKTGKFITVEQARRRPANAVVERVPHPGKSSS
jgi:hypothetical protein